MPNDEKPSSAPKLDSRPSNFPAIRRLSPMNYCLFPKALKVFPLSLLLITLIEKLRVKSNASLKVNTGGGKISCKNDFSFTISLINSC